MDGELLARIKNSIGFGDADAANLKSLGGPMEPLLPGVVARFFDAVEGRGEAVLPVSVDASAGDRLRGHLEAWLGGLFDGRYDATYFRNADHIALERMHARLPQYSMIAGISVIRAELERHVRSKKLTHAQAKVNSLGKLLALEMAVLLEAYKDHYSERIRDSEREAMEAQLTKAEHMAQIGRLAAALAHAIKNPLAGISGAIQVIRGTMIRDDPNRPVIDEMLDQIDRLDSTVKDLLIYSRPRAPARTTLDFNELIARVLSVLREEPALRRIRVVHTRKNALPRMEADERHLEQVVMNLLLNAADASSEGDRIVITTSFDGCIRMEITDTGIGMDTQSLERAFEPFYTTKTKGTGLGLSISSQIVDAHGGRITIHSERRTGTTVTVELPVSEPKSGS